MKSELAVLRTPAVKVPPVIVPGKVPVDKMPPETMVWVKPGPMVKMVAAAGERRRALTDCEAVVAPVTVTA